MYIRSICYLLISFLFLSGSYADDIAQSNGESFVPVERIKEHDIPQIEEILKKWPLYYKIINGKIYIKKEDMDRLKLKLSASNFILFMMAGDSLFVNTWYIKRETLKYTNAFEVDVVMHSPRDIKIIVISPSNFKFENTAKEKISEYCKKYMKTDTVSSESINVIFSEQAN